jgi:hypothetical protein
MAEIKGLKGQMLRLRQRIDNIQRLAGEADNAGSFLESELTDFHDQFRDHRDDLVAAAGVLGNSSGASSKQQSGEKGDAAPLTAGSTTASIEPEH